VEWNIADLFEAVADTVPDRIALVAGSARPTFTELEARANRLAHGLAELGIGAGDHVGCYLHNDAEHLETMLAAYKLRAVPINVNYRYVDDELAYLFADADLAGLVYGAEFRAHVAAVSPRVPTLRAIVEAHPEAAPLAPPGVGMADGTIAYEDVVASGAPVRGFGARSADDHYVIYTGGTTGNPKGVVWRQEDIIFTALGGGNVGGPPLEHPEDITRTVVENRAQRVGPFLPPGHPGVEQFVGLGLGPLMHAGGQWSALGTLLGGGTCVLDPDRHLDLARVCALIEREHIVTVNVVGDAHARPFVDLLDARGHEWDLSSLLLFGSGGSMLSADVKARILAALPNLLGILEGLGSSESPVQGIAITRRDEIGDGEAPGEPSALRFVTRDTTVVLDDDHRVVEPGSGVVGRVATTGRIPLGYYNDPEKTAATFLEVDGRRYALPGDMATVDADGSLRLLGRGSLCINTGGEKVYPEEVEAALKSHPRVLDAVVVGVPDERFGERVAAVVATSDAADHELRLDELQDHCRTTIAGYKVPRALVLVDEVRRSAAGKPDYRWARAVASGA
jgi:acyl-CoA synthetase (AMP-forming)/AMP-acid ligase II